MPFNGLRTSLQLNFLAQGKVFKRHGSHETNDACHLNMHRVTYLYAWRERWFYHPGHSFGTDAALVSSLWLLACFILIVSIFDSFLNVLLLLCFYRDNS